MRILALLLLLASAAAAQDRSFPARVVTEDEYGQKSPWYERGDIDGFKWVTPDTSAPEKEPTSGEPCVADYVYKIRVRGRNVTTEGCGVAIADGQLQTCAHLFEGVTAPVAEVETEPETWTRVSTYTVVPGKDVAFVKVSGQLTHTKRRDARYREKVWVYGSVTAKPQAGIFSDTDSASLDADEFGTKQGDSGGGVFGEDGALLGTIRGSNAAENRVVKFTVNPPLPVSQSSGISGQLKSSGTPNSSPRASVQNCPNGQCGLPAASMPGYHLETGIFGRQRWVKD